MPYIYCINKPYMYIPYAIHLLEEHLYCHAVIINILSYHFYFNHLANKVAICKYYTSRILLTGYVGLISRSTAVASASRSTIEGTMRVLCSYCVRSSLSAFCHSSIRVPS